MTLEEKVAKAQITGRSDVVRGIVFKVREYFINYQVVDVKSWGFVGGEKRVSQEEYAKARINEEFDITLLSYDCKKWYTSKEEADKDKK